MPVLIQMSLVFYSHGDSGSALQQERELNGEKTFNVIGIVSFMIKCELPETPTVYTRVSSYLDWIEAIVWPGRPSKFTSL